MVIINVSGDRAPGSQAGGESGGMTSDRTRETGVCPPKKVVAGSSTLAQHVAMLQGLTMIPPGSPACVNDKGIDDDPAR